MKSLGNLILIAMLMLTAGGCLGDSANVTLPEGFAFMVTGPDSFSNSVPQEQEVSFSGASLTAGYYIRISIKADAENFTRPGESGGFISCDKLGFVTTSTMHATGYAGILSATSWTRVLEGGPNITWGSTWIGWTMNTVGEGVHAGDHILTATWKVESL